MMTPIGLTRDGHLVPKFRHDEREPMIFEQRTYVDDKGVIIIGKTEIDSVREPDQICGKETFSANGILPVVMNGQQAQINFAFEVPGKTVEEAYASFPEAMDQASKKAIADLQAQARQQQILSAASSPAAGQLLRRMNGK